MKRSTVWKHGEPISKSTCYESPDAGRIATGGIWAVICRRTYALSRIRLQCVRGLLSHNDSDPLQKREVVFPVVRRGGYWAVLAGPCQATMRRNDIPDDEKGVPHGYTPSRAAPVPGGPGARPARHDGVFLAGGLRLWSAGRVSDRRHPRGRPEQRRGDAPGVCGPDEPPPHRSEERRVGKE